MHVMPRTTTTSEYYMTDKSPDIRKFTFPIRIAVITIATGNRDQPQNPPPAAAFGLVRNAHSPSATTTTQRRYDDNDVAAANVAARVTANIFRIFRSLSELPQCLQCSSSTLRTSSAPYTVCTILSHTDQLAEQPERELHTTALFPQASEQNVPSS